MMILRSVSFTVEDAPNRMTMTMPQLIREDD